MEEDFVNNYLPELSEETKVLVIKDLCNNNERLKTENAKLKKFYDTLLNTEGLLPMNIVAKELKVGLKRLYSFLRANDVMFYKGNINIPYQSLMEQKLFDVKETPCHDGNYRPATYATRKRVEYIYKLLVKKTIYVRNNLVIQRVPNRYSLLLYKNNRLRLTTEGEISYEQ